MDKKYDNPFNKIYSNPLFLNWNFNYACNFNCSHCYSRVDYKYPELEREQLLHIAREIIKSNVFIVAFGGGEPMVSNWLYELITELSKNGITTFITTNGWFLDAESCQRLKASGLSALYVSLDSAEETVHDDIRGMKGSYKRVINGIREARKANLDVRLSTVVSKINYIHLEEIVGVATELGVSVIQFKRYRPSGNGFLNRDLYELSLEEVQMVKHKILQFENLYSVKSEVHFGVESDEKGCPCGITTLTIRPNGDVSPCSYEGNVVGNVMNQELSKIWTEAPVLKELREGKGCLGLRENRMPLKQL
jgi:MoaA/NifB/PqqE/SkfB family radical SAM enzyme